MGGATGGYDTCEDASLSRKEQTHETMCESLPFPEEMFKPRPNFWVRLDVSELRKAKGANSRQENRVFIAKNRQEDAVFFTALHLLTV